MNNASRTVLDFLLMQGGWYRTDEIAKAAKLTRSEAASALDELHDQGKVTRVTYVPRRIPQGSRENRPYEAIWKGRVMWRAVR